MKAVKVQRILTEEAEIWVPDDATEEQIIKAAEKASDRDWELITLDMNLKKES